MKTYTDYLNEQQKYLATYLDDSKDLCRQQNNKFNDCVSNIQKHLSDHNLDCIVGGIGFDETLHTDGIIKFNSNAVIIRFFINQEGNIVVYSNNHNNIVVPKYIKDVKDDIIFINYILSKPYVINQIKNLPKSFKQAKHQHVFCLLNAQSKNLLNSNGFGNTFIGSDEGLLELYADSLNIEIINLDSTISFLNSESTIPELLKPDLFFFLQKNLASLFIPRGPTGAKSYLVETIDSIETIISDLKSGLSNNNDLSQSQLLKNILIDPISQYVGIEYSLTRYLSRAAWFQNETAVNLLLDIVYSNLDGVLSAWGPPWAVAGNNWWMDVISDDAHKGSIDRDQEQLYELEIFNWETNNTYFKTKWYSLIESVNRANAVIELINNSENPSEFLTQKTQARFLKGHFNFELQRLWENVPNISVENYSKGELNQPNSGPIWNEIEEDFLFAVYNLPLSRTGDYNDPKRPIKTTANSYLGKVFLYQEKWTEALDQFESVVNSGIYTLPSDYFSNFKSQGENGSEMIFSIQFKTDGTSINGNNGGQLNYPYNAYGDSCCGFYQPTQDLANAFQTNSSGLPLENSQEHDIVNDFGIDSDETFIPHTGPLDPRIDYTIGRRGVDYNGFGLFTNEGIREKSYDIGGPYGSKKNMYTVGDDANVPIKNYPWPFLMGNNHHIIRYADVLLMAAESAIEIGQLQKGREYVNKVRNRAKKSPRVQGGMGDRYNSPYSPNYVINTYDSPWTDISIARKAVRHERRVELGMEGHRLFDLRRWKNYEDVMNAYITNEGRTIRTLVSKAGQAQNKHNRFPIPSDAINKSYGVLTQNVGY